MQLIMQSDRVALSSKQINSRLLGVCWGAECAAVCGSTLLSECLSCLWHMLAVDEVDGGAIHAMCLIRSHLKTCIAA